MVMRIQHVEGEYRVVLSAEAMATMNLHDGAEVEVGPVIASRPITAEEAIASYFRTEPRHHDTYTELAK